MLAGPGYAFNGYTGFSGSAVNPRRTGLFVGHGLSYQALLLDSDEAPGAPGTHFRLAPNGFAPSRLTQLNPDGVLAFTAELAGTGVNSTVSDSLNQRGVWSTTFGELVLEMRSNDAAPVFGAGWRFSLPGAVALNVNNGLAFWTAAKRGSFPTTESKFALVSRDFGVTDFNLLYEDSMAVTGLPTTFLQAQGSVATGQVIDLPAPSFNAQGSALVMVDFANPAYHQFGRAEALLVAGPQGLQVVAHTASNNFDVPVPAGNLAVGLPNTVFRDLLTAKLNEVGGVALLAATQSAPGTSGQSGQGVWTGTPGDLQLVAHEGQTLAAGVRIRDSSNGCSLGLSLKQFNDCGEVAFLSALDIDGEDPFGIFTGLVFGDSTQLNLVARTGQGARSRAPSSRLLTTSP